MRTGAIAAFIVSLMLMPALARATTITFNGLMGESGDPFSSYTEGGFTVTSLGDWAETHNFGNPVPDIFANFTTGDTQTVEVTRAGGGLFTFASVDLSTGRAFANYQITGQRNGDNLFVLTGIDAFPLWTTAIGDNTTLVDTLFISQARTTGITGNIDNITVNAVGVAAPEPMSLLLVGTGLLDVGTRRWRKRPRA